MHYLTEYLRREFIPYLDSKGISYVFLYESLDTKDNFEKYVKDADIVIFVGHGMRDLITGFGYIPIVKACENDHLLANKDVCAVACLSGAILGHSAVNKGARLYIGFWREALIILSYDVPDPTDAPIEMIDPFTDKLAYPFLDTFFYPARLLVEGKDGSTIYKMTYDRYNYWIKYALRQGTDEWSEVAKALMWNRDSLVVYPVYEFGIERFVVPAMFATAFFLVPRLLPPKHTK